MNVILNSFNQEYGWEITPACTTEEMPVNPSKFEEFTEELENAIEKSKFFDNIELIMHDEYMRGIKYFSYRITGTEKVGDVLIQGNFSNSNNRSNLEVEAFGKEILSTRRAIATIFHPIAKIEEEHEDEVEVRFWSWSGKNATHLTRVLESNDTESVLNNYTDTTGSDIISLRDNLFDRNGKLVIFSGDPGTGKTTIIRSLLNDWADKAVGEYVIDPETLFNGPPSYMMELIMKDSSLNNLEPWESDYYSEDELKRSKKKKILILEDCGELIKSSAKSDVGTGLARFLNIVDGMIGQGLDITVLLTTNEKIENFHSAVTREGRVNTMIDFERFSPEKTAQWLSDNNVELTDELQKSVEKSNGFSLAECYDVLNKQENQSVKILSSKEKRPAFGFSVT